MNFVFLLLFLFSCTANHPRTIGEIEVPSSSITEEQTPVTSVVPGGTKLITVSRVDGNDTIKLETVPGQDWFGRSPVGDYSVKSSLKVVEELGKIGNCVVMKQKLLDEIKDHVQFDYTTDTSPTVSQKLSWYTPVVLTTYRKPFTKTIAYRNVGSNVIYLNTLKLGRVPTKERLNTIWHERSHVAGYGHGDNLAKGKQNSVPYGTGAMAEKYFDECYAGIK